MLRRNGIAHPVVAGEFSEPIPGKVVEWKGTFACPLCVPVLENHPFHSASFDPRAEAFYGGSSGLDGNSSGWIISLSTSSRRCMEDFVP